jgi:site-specific DNA recombinase
MQYIYTQDSQKERVAIQAIGYVRVSTQGQADEGISLEAQRQRIEAWCLVNEYSVTGVFVDAGVSGKGMTGRQG